MKTKKFEIKNTLGMFDLLKGIIMIAVMLYHTYGLFDFMAVYNSVYDLVRDRGVLFLIIFLLLKVFMQAIMPVLFIISGYGFRKTSLKKCLNKQFKILLVPYLTICVMAFVVNLIGFYVLYGGIRASIKSSIQVLIIFLLGFPKESALFGITIDSNGVGWFLLALMFGNIIFNQLLNHFEGKKLLYSSVISACIGWLLGLGNALPWSISQGFVAAFFLYIGYTAKKKKLLTSPESIKNRNKVVGLIIFATTIVGAIENFNIADSSYIFGPLSIFLYGLYSLLVIYFFLCFNCLKGTISMFVRKVGRLSLYVYCAHTIEFKTIGSYLQYGFANSWRGNQFVRSMIIFGVRAVVVLSTAFLYAHIKTLIVRREK
ncbi:acyltransferase family protein [Butyrivibrio sp. AC2005]|uniref:acyltransferase family protein n=1 Tax=Butyrivibrio sp. AC2005 TaxID=1280672 RepID=UPI00041F93DB|nr:acyltransferase [Butyrivibrio sp. AC2005]